MGATAAACILHLGSHIYEAASKSPFCSRRPSNAKTAISINEVLLRWLQVENCGLSEETVRALHKRGVPNLFPIQKHVFDPAMSGRDLIGRAKTGSGKTLAFSLPVIEALLKVASQLRGAVAGVCQAKTRTIWKGMASSWSKSRRTRARRCRSIAEFYTLQMRVQMLT